MVNENNIEEISPSNINLKSFRPKGELNPKLFPDGERLNKRVRLRLLDIASDFVDELTVQFAEVKDINIIGSIVGYNWSKYSDVDLHIIMDFTDIDDDVELVRDYFDSKKNVWNESKDVKIYGYPVELYVEDINEPAESNGRYSIVENKWLEHPVFPTPIGYEKYFIKKESAKIINIIDWYEKLYQDYIENDDEEELTLLAQKCQKLWTKIKGMRKFGLERNGEMDSYNVIYKVLRRKNSLQKLFDLRDKIYVWNKSIR